MERMITPRRPFYKAGPVVRLGKIAPQIFAAFIETKFSRSGIRPEEGLGDAIVELAENVPYDVHRSKLPGSSVDVFLLGNDRFFDRPGLYVDPATMKDYADQADRWIFFQRAVMEFLKAVSPAPDILHCHDHQTGLIPAYLRKFYQSEYSFAHTRSVFTIHNMGYPGLFPREAMVRAGFSRARTTI